VESIESAIASANEIEYPVALKVVSEEILHKTDAGGVMLGITSDSALRASYEQLAANIMKAVPTLSKIRVLVQKMMPSNYFVGTRCFSSSSQFRTMLIFRGPTAVGAAAVDAGGFIIRNRFPSELRSQAE
jgi:hypothetical protein